MEQIRVGQAGVEQAGVEEIGMSEDTVGEDALEDEHGQELDPSDPLELLGELLEEIVDALGLDVEVEVEETDNVLTGYVAGEDVGLFIGRHGQTIDAVQHLAHRIVFRGGPVKARVVIDADGYRERRAKQLRGEADEAAEEALRLGSAVELAPMPASERRVVHEHLRDRGDVETHSEGEEPERFLVVSPLGV